MPAKKRAARNKKKSKAKAAAKKQAAAAAAERERELQSRIRNAMFLEDGKTPRNVLNDFLPFKAFSHAEFAAAIEFYAADSLPPPLLKQCFDLLKLNMQTMYEACEGWGWSDKKKMKELQSPEARFLVATTGSGADQTVCGFIHFRFSLEGEDPVLYVWEIQIGASARRQGLGKRLSQVCCEFEPCGSFGCMRLSVTTADPSVPFSQYILLTCHAHVCSLYW